MTTPKHEEFIVITNFPLEVSKEQDGQFHLKEVKLNMETVTEDEFLTWLGCHLGQVNDVLGMMDIYFSPRGTIVVQDQESGVITESSKEEYRLWHPYGWYKWLLAQHAYGRVTIQGRPDGDTPSDTDLISSDGAMNLLASQIYALSLALEYEDTGDFELEDHDCDYEGLTEEECEAKAYQRKLALFSMLESKTRQYGELLKTGYMQMIPDTVRQDGDHWY